MASKADLKTGNRKYLNVPVILKFRGSYAKMLQGLIYFNFLSLNHQNKTK